MTHRVPAWRYVKPEHVCQVFVVLLDIVCTRGAKRW
jgi:hypothetical protein